MVGLGVVVALVRHVGVRVIAETLQPALVWLPAICVLDGLRIGCELASSALAFGPVARRIPWTTFLRAHVVGYSLSSVAPAPRVVNETIKVTMLAPHVGVAAATSVALVNQAATLFAVGLFSIPCALAILAASGRSVWFWASLVHALVLVGAGLALQSVARADAAGRWIAKKLPKLAPRAQELQAQSRRTSRWAPGPTGALMLGRSVQVAQFAIAAHAVGIEVGFLRAMAAEGVNLVTLAVGVLVPAGLGTNDGGFALAAGLLGTTVARAASIALLMRCVQLVWVAVGSVLVLFGPRRQGAAAR